MTQNKTTTNTHSNFHSSGLRQKVDQLMDILYAGGVNNPMDSIEQISYLLFLRLLTERDEQLAALSKKYKRIFSGKWARYAWGNFVTLTGDQLFDSTRSAIENLHELPDLSDTGRLLFRRATLKIYDRPTLRAVIQSIHEMDLIEHDGADIKGDMYEYLLSKISMSGTNGQFRTPRHIIDLIVEVVDPKPGRRICDPACGTAGFIISAFNHILKQNTSKADLKTSNITGDKLKPAQWKFLEQQAFTGFDNDAHMIKIAILNLYLHKLEKANIDLHNPLTTTKGGTYPGPQYDCILANPPFSGKVQKESILSDLNHGLNTRATELLFIKWFIDHLADGGRAGVIVPDGIVSNKNNKAYILLRKKLVESGFVYAVVSLHAGVFKPYADVKTSVLFFDKNIAKLSNAVLFMEINNDGYEKGNRKRPIDKNDIPNAIDTILSFKTLARTNQQDIDKWLLHNASAYTVAKDKIAEDGNYILRANKYKVGTLSSSTLAMQALSKHIEEINIRNNNENTKVFSVSNEFGLVNSDEYFSASVTSRSLQNYKVVGPNYFVYNPARVNVGSMALNDTQSEGVVSPMYTVFRIKETSNLVPEYLYYLLKSNKGIKAIRWLSSGTVRQTLKFSDLENIEIPIPQHSFQLSFKHNHNLIINARRVIDEYMPYIKINPRWEKVKLTDYFSLEKGTTPIKKAKNGKYQLVTTGDTFEKCDTYQFDGQAIVVPLISSAGHGKASLKRIYYIEGKFAVGNILMALLPKNNRIIPRFYFYLFSQEKDAFFTNLMYGTSNVSYSIDDCKDIEIPKVPLSEQRNILSKIDAELTLIKANEKLVAIYVQKIKDKIAEVWGYVTSQATVKDKTDKMADSGLLIADVAELYRTDVSLACLVLQHFKKQGKTIREFHLQKYAYIAQQHLKLPIASEFQPMAAGPWSSAFKNYACAYARQQQWFSLKGRNVEPGKALKAGTAEAEKILGRQRGKVLQLLDDLKRFGDSGLERWATILMVVSQLKTAGKAVTRRNIQEAIDNWSGKRNKEWFTSRSVSKAIDGMNQKGWIKLIGE